MRRYAPNASPDDPEAWVDMSGFWPTKRGTYINSDAVESVAKTATGETSVLYCFCAKTLTATRCYVVGAVKIWEAAAAAPASTTLTDRTNAMAIGASPHMAQYGNITICAMGAAAGTPTIISSGTTFSALGGGSPSAEIVVVCNNVVLLFNYYDGANTYNDGWWASDVGDYTTWTPATSNDAANGRFLDTNGPVVGACALGNYVYAFKTDAIYRGQYVGGVIKWAWERVIDGIGMRSGVKNGVVSCGDKLAFVASSSGNSNQTNIMLYDGVSKPITINPELDLLIGSAALPYLTYDAATSMLFIMRGRVVAGGLNTTHAFNLTSGLWGISAAVYGADSIAAVGVMGDVSATGSHFSAANTSPHAFYRSASNEIKIQYPTGAASGSVAIAPYVQTTKMGEMKSKTTFSRLTPLLRSRVARSGAGSGTCALSVTTFCERHDADSAVTSTTAVTESTIRKRFDFGVTDCFAKFKVTFTDLIVEIDDVDVKSIPAGTD